MHIDCNQEEGILVYPYFRSTLLALIQEDPDFPPAERKKFLRRVGEATSWQRLDPHRYTLHNPEIIVIQDLN